MKKIHIIGIIIIVVAIGAMVTSLADAGTYANFSVAEKNEGSEYHVVGKLDKAKEMVYDPVKDPNVFTFYLVDNNNVERKVILYKSKPQDFEKSEQIVLIGKAKNGEFHANEVLMKCPSKYNDTKTANITLNTK